MSSLILHETIERKIYLIRGHKVMLDRDLAALYGVPTKRLKEQVRRNLRRFPPDFMFQLSQEELENWRSHFASSNPAARMGLRRPPFAFTEQGVAMLSSILNSERAIQVNIQIMRIFTKLKELMFSNKELALKLQILERKFTEHDRKFEVVFDAIRELIQTPKENTPKIGFKS